MNTIQINMEKQSMKERVSDRQTWPADRLGYLWLALGLLCWLFAANGARDVPMAAWLAPLFLLRFTRTRAALRGCVGIGLVALIVTIFWQVESNFYDFQHPLSVVNLLVLAILLSSHLLLAVPYLLDRLLAPRLGRGVLASLIFPLGLVGSEYLSTHVIPYGFFFSPAYTQYGNLPLIQLVSVTGTYGVTFLIAWFASSVNGTWEQRFTWSRIRGSALFYSGALALVLLYGGIRLAYSAPSAQTVRAAGVSATRASYERAKALVDDGDLDQAKIRTALSAVTNELLDASRREARAGAKIIVWPEMGTYTISEDEATLIGSGESLARTEHVYLEMAYGVYEQGETTGNRAVLIDPEGGVVWKYDKAHPGMSLATVKDGPGIVPTAETPYGHLATVICIDAWYPDLMQQVGNRDVDLMLVPGQEWPGVYRWAPQDSSFRAIEYGYSLVRPAGWDLGMIFDAQGRVLATSDYYTTNQQIVVAFVPMKGTWTVYGLVGDLFVWLCMASLFVLTALVVIRSLVFAKSATPSVQPPRTASER